MHRPLYTFGMLSDENVAYLQLVAARVDANADALRDAVRLRDDAIRMALTENKAGVGELVNITGLSRARVYQIRDGG